MFKIQRALNSQIQPRSIFIQQRTLHTSSFLLKKTVAKPAVKPKETTNVQPKKKPKMSDAEFYAKAEPLLARDNLTDYELIGKIANGTKIIVGSEVAFDYTDKLEYKDNVTFRNKEARKIMRSQNFHKLETLVENFLPRIDFSVLYPEEVTVLWGNRLKLEEVTEKPIVSFPMPIEVRRYWTLLLVSQLWDKPDIQYNHWIVGNIPFNKIEKGEVLSEYLPTVPFKDKGLHRYTFILFQQTKKISFDSFKKQKEDTLVDRANFNTIEFQKQFDLTTKGIKWFYLKSNLLDLSFVDLIPYENNPPPSTFITRRT